MLPLKNKASIEILVGLLVNRMGFEELGSHILLTCIYPKKFIKSKITPKTSRIKYGRYLEVFADFEVVDWEIDFITLDVVTLQALKGRREQIHVGIDIGVVIEHPGVQVIGSLESLSDTSRNQLRVPKGRSCEHDSSIAEQDWDEIVAVFEVAL